MAGKRPTTIAEYIEAAPSAGQPHCRQIYAILKSVAPHAQEAIKWGTPFFIEPRFLFAFSAHKEHLDFAPMAVGLDPFRDRTQGYATTKNFLKVRYDQELPEALILEIARRRVRDVAARKDDSFW